MQPLDEFRVAVGYQPLLLGGRHLSHRVDVVPGSPPIRRYRHILALLLVATMSAQAACTYERVIHDGWGEFEAMADEQTIEGQADEREKQQPEQAYAILLDIFSGPKRVDDARMTKDWLETEQNFTDLWLREAGETIQLVYGRYEKRDSDLALHDLRSVRDHDLQGLKPYETAELIPVRRDEIMAESPLDARNHIGMFTLQIGFYDQNFGENFRQAAVDAAKAIRADGDEAYYYHGRNVSMVMVGLFTEDDFKAREIAPGVTVDSYGPEILKLQEKYPYNLGNGRTLIETVNRRNTGAQESFLVRIR